METVPAVCPLDCPDTCSLDDDVEEGRVRKLDGNRRNPLTDGFICGKVRRFARHMYGEDRLRTPLMRDGARGQFREATWDEALARVAGEMRRVREASGGEAILPFAYGGSNGYLSHESVDARLFRRLGASRLLPTFCAAPTGAAHQGLYGRMTGVALEDYEHAQLIVVWGCNPSATGIHLVPVIKRAQARGAKLVVIDPREIPLAAQADLHLAPRVGTDLPLALSVIHWLFSEGRADLDFLAAHTTGADTLRGRAADWPLARAADICGVPAADLARFAELYADTSPAVIRCGWGQERNRNGGSSSAAIFALPAVAGKFGVRGGGFTSSNSRAFGLRRDGIIAEPEPDTRTVNMTQLGRALTELTDPPIELLFVYNSNPVATAPEQARVVRGMEREDLFTVVFEQVMTDTARLADVVLPATTFLEHRELRNGYGAMTLIDAPPAAAPVGQARPNHQVFGELLDRLELARPGDPREADDLVAAVIDSADDAPRLRAELAERGAASPAVARPVQMVDVVPRTPSGRIELCPPALDAEAPLGLYRWQPDPATAAYPLALISPALAQTVSSTLGQLLDDPATVELHPDDAATRNIANGDPVRVFNPHAEVHCLASLNPRVRPGVASLAKGLWRKHTTNGLTSNALCPDTESDLGRGACYNDARVQIEPSK